VCATAKRGDAVYFDPPYDPVSKTSNFTAYHHDAFVQDDHKRLAKTFKALDRKKVAVVLSNSYTDFTKTLFASWTVSEISVSRPINSKASARGNVRELLVTNHAGEPLVTRRSRQ
jgi:DNA adenine methylase